MVAYNADGKPQRAELLTRELESAMVKLRYNAERTEQRHEPHMPMTGDEAAALLQHIVELDRRIANRDIEWVQAMGYALGLDSGFMVPIVPKVESFKELFAAIRAKYQQALAVESRAREGREELLQHIAALEQRIAELERGGFYTELDIERGKLKATELLLSFANTKIAALTQRVEALQDIVRSHANGRCYACNWTLAENRNKGCVPGDCSFRPHSSDPEHAKWLERAEFERAALSQEPRDE